jgi:hypothetical protein
MAFRYYIARINWRLILVHYVAIWFFLKSFQTFGYLYNTDLVNIYLNEPDGKWQQALSKLSAVETVNIILYPAIAASIGMLVGFIMSLILSICKKWFWVNSLLAFALVYLLSWLHLLDISIIRVILLFPGRFINNATHLIIFNGSILIFFGLLLFFSRWSNRFIQKTKSIVV